MKIITHLLSFIIFLSTFVSADYTTDLINLGKSKLQLFLQELVDKSVVTEDEIFINLYDIIEFNYKREHYDEDFLTAEGVEFFKGAPLTKKDQWQLKILPLFVLVDVTLDLSHDSAGFELNFDLDVNGEELKPEENENEVGNLDVRPRHDKLQLTFKSDDESTVRDLNWSYYEAEELIAKYKGSLLFFTPIKDNEQIYARIMSIGTVVDENNEKFHDFFQHNLRFYVPIHENSIKCLKFLTGCNVDGIVLNFLDYDQQKDNKQDIDRFNFTANISEMTYEFKVVGAGAKNFKHEYFKAYLTRNDPNPYQEMTISFRPEKTSPEFYFMKINLPDIEFLLNQYFDEISFKKHAKLLENVIEYFDPNSGKNITIGPKLNLNLFERGLLPVLYFDQVFYHLQKNQDLFSFVQFLTKSHFNFVYESNDKIFDLEAEFKKASQAVTDSSLATLGGWSDSMKYARDYIKEAVSERKRIELEERLRLLVYNKI